MIRSPVLATLAALLPAPALAQRVYAEATGAVVRVTSDGGTAIESLNGSALALGAGLSLAMVGLEARYLQGSLTSNDPAIEPRDVVEGELLLAVRPHPRLAVKAGPHVRTYAAASGTRRWVFWEARVRGAAPLIPSRLDAYAELWGAVAGSTSLSGSFGNERGGEVGARLEIPRTPLSARLAYRIDHGSGAGPDRSDTLEQILFGVRVTRR